MKYRIPLALLLLPLCASLYGCSSDFMDVRVFNDEYKTTMVINAETEWNWDIGDFRDTGYIIDANTYRNILDKTTRRKREYYPTFTNEYFRENALLVYLFSASRAELAFEPGISIHVQTNDNYSSIHIEALFPAYSDEQAATIKNPKTLIPVAALIEVPLSVVGYAIGSTHLKTRDGITGYSGCDACHYEG